MAGRQQLETQMLEIRSAYPQSRINVPEESRRFWPVANQPHIALRRDQRVERVEQDADGRCETDILRRASSMIEQQRPRGLQLLRQRRLLPDRRAVSRLEIGLEIEDRGDGAQIDRKIADRFACHQ